jgi:hypothetical protein
MKTLFKLFFLITLFLTIVVDAQSQQKTIIGTVKDSHSEEVIPFASIQFTHSGMGKLSDSAGNFSFHLSHWLSDTLIISYAGFDTKYIKLDTTLQSINLTILLERGTPTGEIVVKSKINRGLILWKKIVKHKPENNRSNFKNLSYDIYNKLEIDINNFNKSKLEKSLIPSNPLHLILNNIDTISEDHPILPVFLTETISKYYNSQSPKKTKEIVTANKIFGVNNESFSKLLGGMYQNINVYNNFIPVFDLAFVSPISENGNIYYNYKVPDTQFVAQKRIFHFVFYPKHKGENTFQGDAWIEDSSFAVQKMNLRISPSANINFIDKLSLVQEFQKSDSSWVLAKDKFVADFYLMGKKNIGLIGRKTTSYSNYQINKPITDSILDHEKLKESIEMNAGATDKPADFWKENRPEQLTTKEIGIYQTADTLFKMPSFQRFRKNMYFITVGYKNIGNFEIGPWFNWISSNRYEGFRTRFDLGTNTHFDKNTYFHGYLAYGFKDNAFKGMFEVKHLISRNPRIYIYGKIKNDIDYGQTYFDEIAYDNIFSLASRKAQVPIKLTSVKEQNIELFRSWENGFSIKTDLRRKVYTPLLNLPIKEQFISKISGEVFNSFEASINLRFAYLEKFIEGDFYRTSLGSELPVTEIGITKGIPGVLNSSYRYTKLNFTVSDNVSLAPLGSLYYNIYAGKTYGTAPYMFLSIAPGNEMYYYNKYAFNLMNRYEYLTDQYVGLTFEHSIGNGLFRLIPPTRVLKFRQFWNAKLLMGSLSNANKTLNYVDGHPFAVVSGKPYIELGTGIDNILKFFRVDFVWRVSPQPLPQEAYKRFGIFGSFNVSF